MIEKVDIEHMSDVEVTSKLDVRSDVDASEIIGELTTRLT
jgi:hypothetical protein